MNKITEQIKENYFFLKQLKNLYLSTKDIQSLGEPDLICDNPQNENFPIKLYEKEKVNRFIQNNPEIKQKIQDKENRIQKEIEDKKQKIQKSKEILEKWNKKYPNEILAKAEAIFHLNKWIRTLKRTNFTEAMQKQRIYILKDNWIENNQKYLTHSAKVRDEYNLFGELTGTLYVQKFIIDDTSFNFHSYKKPEKLFNNLANDDLPSYGTLFNQEEMKNLPVKLEDLLEALWQEYYHNLTKIT